MNPFAHIPAQYNMGVALTAGNVARGRGDHVCLYWEDSSGRKRRVTYGELDTLTNQLASALVALGVKAGDRVLLRLPNLVEFYVSALAVAKLGGVFIPTSTQFRTDEIAYRLRDSEAVCAITLCDIAEPLVEARAKAPDCKHVLCITRDGAPLPAGALDFWQVLESGATTAVAATTRHDDISFIAYTSGTTGDPKGVVHYQRYPIAYESLIRYWHDFQEDDVCACPAELGWLLPVASTFLYAMRMGISIVLYHPLHGRFEPAAWFRLFEEYKITNFVATPTIYRMLTADAGIAKANLSTVRHGVSAGEPLPPDTIATVERHFGFVPLDGIGMSECMVYCFNRIDGQTIPGSCGRPAPDCEIRLMNEELEEVPVGQEGVLCVRRTSHPGMMKEYWRKPEQTAEIFQGDWYVSGDVLVKDETGLFWFKGRNDDVMKASGYRISPFEVESCLVEHPDVLEAAAVTHPDEVRGQIVKAVIVLRDPAKASDALAADIQAFTKARLAPYKYPRKIEFVKELPKTTSGKIKRRLLRQS